MQNEVWHFVFFFSQTHELNEFCLSPPLSNLPSICFINEISEKLSESEIPGTTLLFNGVYRKLVRVSKTAGISIVGKLNTTVSETGFSSLQLYDKSGSIEVLALDVVTGNLFIKIIFDLSHCRLFQTILEQF